MLAEAIGSGFARIGGAAAHIGDTDDGIGRRAARAVVDIVFGQCIQHLLLTCIINQRHNAFFDTRLVEKCIVALHLHIHNCVADAVNLIGHEKLSPD